MKLCSCSERPLGIVDSRVIIKDEKPYQVLYFGCTNKGCSEYKKKVWLKKINLFDNSDTIESDI